MGASYSSEVKWLCLIALLASYWVPSAADSYQWLLGGPFDTSANATIYDLDGFDTTAAQVKALHALGRHVVCYVDAGTIELYRPDAEAVPVTIIGSELPAWPNEFWLDIRSIDILEPFMAARMDRCKNKGFDAVEADNVDGYRNTTGFPVYANDQLAYNSMLASLAHARGMSIALKNDPGQAATLQPKFDFALEERCWEQGWCAKLAPFRAAHKLVVTVEYTDHTTPSRFLSNDCPKAKAAGYVALLKHRTLDAYALACP